MNVLEALIVVMIMLLATTLRGVTSALATMYTSETKSKHMTVGINSKQKGKKNETMLLLHPYFLDH